MINAHIDKLSSFHGLLLYFFVACDDSGTLQYTYLLLIHHIIPFAIHCFVTFVTRKCFNKVLPYCTVRSYHVACWWYYVYSLATASSAESANTDLPIRRYLDFAARSVKNDSFNSIGAKLPRKVLRGQRDDGVEFFGPGIDSNENHHLMVVYNNMYNHTYYFGTRTSVLRNTSSYAQ